VNQKDPGKRIIKWLFFSGLALTLIAFIFTADAQGEGAMAGTMLAMPGLALLFASFAGFCFRLVAKVMR
jgi:hypothetical protein